MIGVRHREDPTPSEIAEKCREIQAGWTDDERIRRRQSAGDESPGFPSRRLSRGAKDNVEAVSAFPLSEIA
jgi:hypothetical protein